MKPYKLDRWESLCDPQNWREEANMFPMLDESELQALAESIKMNGLQNPITLFSKKVLDGRNRLLACRLAGVTPLFIDWQDNGKSPAEWVVTENVMRRSLTVSQKAYAALYLIKNAQPTKETKAAFKKWDRRIWLGNLLGINRHAISDIVQIEKWAMRDASCTQWDTLPDTQHPELLEEIKTAIHSTVSMCRKIDFIVAQKKNPELTAAENEECSTGDLAKNFFELVPRHSMQLAFASALKSLPKNAQEKLTRYWTRLEKEYAWYEG